MFYLPVPTLIYTYLWQIYIFLGSVCLFCCREICRPIQGIYKSLTCTHECGNWDWGRAIARKGIHKWDFPSSVDSTFKVTLTSQSGEKWFWLFFGWCPSQNLIKKRPRPLAYNDGSDESTLATQFEWPVYPYCPTIRWGGQNEPYSIRNDKLERRPFFISHFKGTPSQGEQKSFYATW